jgi:hypothetical protein
MRGARSILFRSEAVRTTDGRRQGPNGDTIVIHTSISMTTDQ